MNKRRNIFCIWADFIKKERNAVNVIGAIARRQLRMEVFSRIRLVARERFLEANAERIITNLFTCLKSGVLHRSFSRWRVRSYTDCVKEMLNRKELLAETIRKHREQLERMEAVKERKAIKFMRQRKQREITNKWIERAKELKSKRVKMELLTDNIGFLQRKWGIQRWSNRVKMTGYLRRKNTEAVRRLRERTMMKVYKQWALRVQICKTLCQKTFKYTRRMQCLQLADGFSQLLHFSRSFAERDKERRQHCVQSSAKILSRLLKNRMSDTFLSLRVRA